MAHNPLTRTQIATRLKLVIEENYETYKAYIGDDVEPLRLVQAGPLAKAAATPAVGIYYEKHTGEDSAQVTGETRDARYMVEALVEMVDFEEADAEKANDVADTIEYLLKKENQLLHPTTGTKLQWLWRIHVSEGEIRWLHKRGRAGGMAHIRIPVRVVIDENLTY